MLPDRVSNPGPLTYESGALPIALRGPAHFICIKQLNYQETGDNQKAVMTGYLNGQDILFCLPTGS